MVILTIILLKKGQNDVFFVSLTSDVKYVNLTSFYNFANVQKNVALSICDHLHFRPS